jgi:hypothetical protein
MVRCTAELGGGLKQTSAAAGAAEMPGTGHSPAKHHREVYSGVRWGWGEGGLEQTSTEQGQWGRRGQVIVLQYNMVRCTSELGGGLKQTSAATGAAETPRTGHSPTLR